MLKPLTTKFKGREISLECTHKQSFPPPQMYGHTPEDVDTLWKQGAVDQNQYQHLKVWQDICGQMVMGPKCLDCSLALKQNPRPGRPHVIETESWLAAKEKMHWRDMAIQKEPLENRKPSMPPSQPKEAAEHDPPSKRNIANKMVDNGILESESNNPPSTEADKTPLVEEREDDVDQTLVDEDLGAEIKAATTKKGFTKRGAPVPVTVVEPESEKPTLLDALKNPDEILSPETEKEDEAEDETGLNDSILDALADD